MGFLFLLTVSHSYARFPVAIPRIINIRAYMHNVGSYTSAGGRKIWTLNNCNAATSFTRHDKLFCYFVSYYNILSRGLARIPIIILYRFCTLWIAIVFILRCDWNVKFVSTLQVTRALEILGRGSFTMRVCLLRKNITWEINSFFNKTKLN